jgi:hypothetical protein
MDLSEVRGRYRLESVVGRAAWCANGKIQGNRSLKVNKGEGEFHFTFSIVKNGNLPFYYPAGGGELCLLY